MKSIKSRGGPLICVSERDRTKWCGILGSYRGANCVSTPISDYERACAVRGYAGTLYVGDSVALVLGDMPLETTAWSESRHISYIVRTVYSDPAVDVRTLVSKLLLSVFDQALERTNLRSTSSRISIFDSALAGNEVANECLTLETDIGTYEVNTVVCEPDERTSLVIHRLSLQ
jgi:hypothetical protein